MAENVADGAADELVEAYRQLVEEFADLHRRVVRTRRRAEQIYRAVRPAIDGEASSQ